MILPHPLTPSPSLIKRMRIKLRASSKKWLLKEAFKIKYSLPLNLQRPRHMYNERSGAALCLMAEDFRSGSEKWMMLISIRDPGHRNM